MPFPNADLSTIKWKKPPMRPTGRTTTSMSTLYGPATMNGRYHVGIFIHYQLAEDLELWIESPRGWQQKHHP